MEQGFVDLRSNADVASDNSSFWPSFTDIMMVVMMIFMLASVVLILRNWELVAELRNTMEAERQAAEMARAASETNATLEEQLAQAQHLLSELRMQLMQAEEADKLKSQLLTEREQSLKGLQERHAQLETALQESQQRIVQLDTQVSQQQERLSAQSEQLIIVQGKLATLEQEYRNKTDELDRLKKTEQHSSSQLVLLQGEYDQLKVKYDKLVKPARSAKGKHVVEVRYEKLGKDYRINFKEQGDSGYRTMERKELEQHLDGLKKRYPKKLYVKMIIPAESGLSYNEAWAFMKRLLEKYDYYYQ